MQSQIAEKSDRIKKQGVAISMLEQDNIKLSARVAELEARLKVSGREDIA